MLPSCQSEAVFSTPTYAVALERAVLVWEVTSEGEGIGAAANARSP